MSRKPRLRIGELSRRVGVSPELLRAWETRYGLVQPERTAGGLRLFSEEDVRRVLLMQRSIAAGLSASEAARHAKETVEDAPEDTATLEQIEGELERALDTLDEPLAQVALDRLFTHFGLQVALSGVVLPFLHRLGERWASGAASVAEEHFASNVIGGRLRGLSRDWGMGAGPRAILACPPGERHELGLICFGLALREHGWRIVYLGAETPLSDIDEALREQGQTVVVLAAVTPEPFVEASEQIGELRDRVRVALGGRGASAGLAERLGVELLSGDAIAAAAALAR